MKAPAPPRGQIDALTGLRFIAAFLVLFSHGMDYLVADPVDPKFWHLFTPDTSIGMPLFFVLSGFVIHYNYGPSLAKLSLAPLWRFFVARFARLYPLYFAALLFSAWQLSAVSRPDELRIWLKYLTLTQAWFPTYQGRNWEGGMMLAPAWSISVEVFFYLSYVLWAGLLLRVRKIWVCCALWLIAAQLQWTSLFLSWLNAGAFYGWGEALLPAEVPSPDRALLRWLFDVGPLARALEFFMGTFIAQIYLLWQQRAMRISPALSSLLAALLVGAIAGLHYAGSQSAFCFFAATYSGYQAPLLAALILLCAVGNSWLSRVMASRPMVVLGDASYSLYLLHIFIMVGFFSVAWPLESLQWLPPLLLFIVLCLGASLLTYRWFEVPSRHYLRRALAYERWHR